MGRRKQACNRPEGGSCIQNGACRFKICTLCIKHCKCQSHEPEVVKTPKPKRCNHQEIVARIAASVVNRTPAAMKTSDTDFRSWKDFCELVPRSPHILECLHDTIEVTVTMGSTVRTKLISYAVDVVKKLGQVVAQRDQATEVQEMLLEGIAKRYNPEYRREEQRRKVVEHATREILNELLAYARGNKKDDEGSRLIRSIITRHLNKDDLDFVQDQAGIPQDKRVSYGVDARAKGRQDYSKMFLSGDDNICVRDVTTSSILSMSRVSDKVVMDAVGCIVGQCDIKSWGQKTVPIGDGEVIDIPALTRKCGLEEMWNGYSQSTDKQKVEFDQISRHDGPFKVGHQYYKGSVYNLLILWADGSNSWEPLFDFQKDDPVTCAFYGKANDLLDLKGWVGLKRKLKEDGTADGEVTLRAFKGGRKVLGRTSFIELAQVLTVGGEKLITSIDYVRGVLIHDVVDVLQRIIDDCVTSNQKKADLTRMLKNASNFLKNQYKGHVTREDGCDTHGINHGLRAHAILKTKKHYSCFETEQLDKLLQKRGLSVRGKTTIAARIQALEDCDQREDEGHGDLPSSSMASESSDEIVDRLIERLNRMNLKQLREEVKSQHLAVKDRKPQLLQNALYDHYSNNTPELTEEEASTVTELELGTTKKSDEESIEFQSEPVEYTRDEGEAAPNCLGCAFIHKFMLDTLPQSIKNEQTDENKDSIDNALQYIEDAHEKFMLYMGHQVRVVNQNKKLNEYDEALKNRCRQDRNLEATYLFLIVDFKMKWEATYQREKTNQNFGKRGISWHGNRAQYYVWDDEKQEPVKKIIKLDQILEGTNKQDGLTVLALIEATLVYLHQEFPHASVEYIQSDNAAAYHVKELVLAIPLLNDVRKQ